MLGFAEQDHLLRQQFVGNHRGSAEGAPHETPINMIEQGVNIMLRGVTSHSPQVVVGTNYDELLPGASDLELVINEESERINLGESFSACAFDAMFTMGVMEVGITSGDTPPDGEGYQYDPGHVFADPILFEDLILDMNANDWDKMQYVGHDFDVLLDWAKSNPEFDREARSYLGADEELRSGEQRSEAMSRSGRRDPFSETVRLRQIYLRNEGKLLTLAANQGWSQLLREIDWEGPEHGPYHQLAYWKIPGNVIPLAPVPLWFDMHNSINRIASQVLNQAERQKTFTAVPGLAAQDGQQIPGIQDGGVYHFENPEKIKEVSMGGANQENLQIILWLKGLLETMGGNWPVLGGLGAQSRTIGQERLIYEQASGRLEQMQRAMYRFQSIIFQDMGFWLFNDPVSEFHSVKQIGNSGLTIPVVFSPENRMGKYFHYNFQVNPFASRDQTPSERANSFLQLIQEVLLPISPLLAEQGMALKWEYIIKTLAHHLNLPELGRSVIYSQGEKMPQRQHVGAKPAQTERRYVRENVSGQSQTSPDEQLLRFLEGQNGRSEGLEQLLESA